MKNQVIILIVAGLLCLPVANSRGTLTITTEKDENDLERFMNVEKWRGNIKISINETGRFQDVGSEDYYTFKVNHQYGHNFITGEGEMNVTDPFYDQGDQDAEENEELEDYDEDFDDYDEEEMEEMDMAAIQNFMKDFDPDDIEGSLNNMNIGFDSYKVWTLFGMQGVEMGESNSDYLILDEYISHNVYSGEGCAGCCPITKKELFEANGKENNGTFHLSINIKDGIYGFVTSFGGNDYKLEQSVNYNRESCPGTGDVFKDEINQVPGPYPNFITSMPGKPEMKNQPLPAEGLTLAGSATLEGFGFARNPLDGSKIAMDATISWIFVPADQEIPEVILSTEDKDWIQEEDNTIEVKVTWQEVVPSEIEFTLFDISEEPGICLNSQDDNTEPDMVILNEDQQVAYDISKKDGSVIALTKNPSSGSEILVVRAQDYGAHAWIRARIKVNGAWYDAEVQDPEGMDLHLPFDENRNHIADKWEKEVGIYDRNYPPNWDFDPFPDKQKSNGDGFALYEEYRGFKERGHLFKEGKNEQVKGDHVRTDPMYKDVFVYDQDGLFREHYASHNPADLNWHYIDNQLMKYTGNVEDDENRWVNYRTSYSYSNQKQYAMWVRYWPVGGNTPTSGGESPRKQSCNGEYPGNTPLKCIYMVRVTQQGILNALSGISDQSRKQRLFSELLTTTVIHEIGHGLGIAHHYNNIGTDEPDKLFWELGVKDCSMRYETSTEIRHNDKLSLLKTNYCQMGEEWIRINKEQPQGTEELDIEYETYPAHDCYWQINIKGD